jgi:hypothetical protein
MQDGSPAGVTVDNDPQGYEEPLRLYFQALAKLQSQAAAANTSSQPTTTTAPATTTTTSTTTTTTTAPAK